MSFKANGELMPTGGGDNIPLLRDHLKIGRRETCDVCLKLPNISGVHAELTFKSGYWYIKDCSSTNGVKVNGTRVQQEKLLQPRDLVTIGPREYVIRYDAPANQINRLEEAHEENILGTSLLERAGLAKPRGRGGRDRED
ncbi:MAG: FHA domain-containing protein [Gemmataceae bacterium]